MPTAWDRHGVLAAIQRQGETLSSLEKKLGIPANTLSVALCRPYPKGEKIISSFLKVPRSKLFKFHSDDKRTQRKSQHSNDNRLAADNDSQKRPVKTDMGGAAS